MTKDNMSYTASEKIEKIEKIKKAMETTFVDGSKKALVFLSNNKDGTYYAAFARGTEKDGLLMTYRIDGRVFLEPFSSVVAEAFSTSIESLKHGNDFHRMLAVAASACACSAREIPGVMPVSCIAGPMAANIISFLSQHELEDIQSVSVKKAKSVSWMYGQATKPKPVKREADLLV